MTTCSTQDCQLRVLSMKEKRNPWNGAQEVLAQRSDVATGVDI